MNAYPTQLSLYPELKRMSKTSSVSLFIHVWSVGGRIRWKHLWALWKLLICNAACSKGAKHGESICSSGADSFSVTVVTSGPSRMQVDLMALVLSSSLRSHRRPAMGDRVWRIWYPVVAESIFVFAKTTEVKWIHTALCSLPLTPP